MSTRRAQVAGPLIELGVAIPLALAAPLAAGELNPGVWLFWIGLVLWCLEAVLPLLAPRWSAGRIGTLVNTVLLIGAGGLGGLANWGVRGFGMALVPAVLLRAVRTDRGGTPGLVAITAGSTAGLVVGSFAANQPEMLILALPPVAVVLLLTLLRRRARQATEQDKLLLTQQIESERQRAENAALTERARLAGDLHDVLAHSLGALTAQLNAAEALLDADRVPEARQKVTASRRLAADGLAEARRAVAALRGPDGLEASLAELVRVHRDSGETVMVETTGTPQRLDPATEQAAHRVIQELLTNARKHAPGAPVDLEISWSAQRLAISASNRLGADSAHPGGLGHGLTAMRERVGRLGGQVRAGRTPEDEFVVTCTLPTSPSEGEH
ncbi:hypothetical protein CGZ98_12960 [Enemella evansiae]|uniref:sensor histidine kinase n=1 Tax=Enemella evansiae TaxID=2016499 RepID=UPI000B96A108|nr:histidine kinase [Enemella evansiae]OYO10005.1 hypothetical protein CGZ98_12960 [Enemella evansiae]